MSRPAPFGRACRPTLCTPAQTQIIPHEHRSACGGCLAHGGIHAASASPTCLRSCKSLGVTRQAGRHGLRTNRWPSLAASRLAVDSHAATKRCRDSPCLVCHHADAPAPLRLRQRMLSCCLCLGGGSGPCRSTLVTASLRHRLYSARPLRLSVVTSKPASTSLIRLHLGSCIVALALPDSIPAPRSERP